MGVLVAAFLGAIWLIELPSWCYASTLLLPVVSASEPSPLRAGLSMAAFSFFSMSQFLVGMTTYFDSIGAGLAIFVAIIILVFSAGCCVRKFFEPPMAAFCLLIAVSVPPVSFAMWPNPLAVVGILLPHTQYYGLAAAILIIAIAARSKALYMPLLALLPVCAFASSLLIQPYNNETSETWAGVDVSQSELTELDDYKQHLFLQRASLSTDTPNVLLPELVVSGYWSDHACDIWHRFIVNQPRLEQVMLGAAIPTVDQDFHNALIVIDATGCTTGYVQQMPIPIAMWRPWQEQSATVGFMHSNAVANALICYDTTQPISLLRAFSSAPPVVFHAANLWWAPEQVSRTQHILTTSWSRLFRTPLIEAYANE